MGSVAAGTTKDLGEDQLFVKALETPMNGSGSSSNGNGMMMTMDQESGIGIGSGSEAGASGTTSATISAGSDSVLNQPHQQQGHGQLATGTTTTAMTSTNHEPTTGSNMSGGLDPDGIYAASKRLSSPSLSTSASPGHQLVTYRPGNNLTLLGGSPYHRSHPAASTIMLIDDGGGGDRLQTQLISNRLTHQMHHHHPSHHPHLYPLNQLYASHHGTASHHHQSGLVVNQLMRGSPYSVAAGIGGSTAGSAAPGSNGQSSTLHLGGGGGSYFGVSQKAVVSWREGRGHASESQ